MYGRVTSTSLLHLPTCACVRAYARTCRRWIHGIEGKVRGRALKRRRNRRGRSIGNRTLNSTYARPVPLRISPAVFRNYETPIELGPRIKTPHSSNPNSPYYRGNLSTCGLSDWITIASDVKLRRHVMRMFITASFSANTEYCCNIVTF